MGVQGVDIDMPHQRDVLPVIQSGPFQRTVVHSKTRNADDMQHRVSCCAKPCDIARVGRYLGFIEGNMQHGDNCNPQAFTVGNRPSAALMN